MQLLVPAPQVFPHHAARSSCPAACSGSESLTHRSATQLSQPAQLPAGDALTPHTSPSPLSQAQGSPAATAQERCGSLCCWGSQHTLLCAPHILRYLTAHYPFCPAPLSTPKQTCQWPAPTSGKGRGFTELSQAAPEPRSSHIPGILQILYLDLGSF